MADTDEALTYLNAGNDFYDQGLYKEAIGQYRKATEINPEYAAAYNNWGLALSAQKLYGEAIGQYRKATEIKPDYVYAYNNWGNALSAQKQYEEAKDIYQRAKQADPDDAYSYHNLAFLLDRQGLYKAGLQEWQEARKAYERTKIKKAGITKTADFHQYYGSVLHENREIQRNCIERLDELNEAEQIYKDGLALDACHAGIFVRLVDLYLKKMDEDVGSRTIYHWKAREAYTKAENLLKGQLEQEETAPVFFQLGALYLKMEAYQEARSYLCKSLEKDKENAETYANLGVVFSRQENFKKAVQYFEDAIKWDSDNLAYYSNLAEAYLKKQQVEKAEAEYKKILAIAPKHVESHIGLGEVYTVMADQGDGDLYGQAIRYFSLGINIAY